MVQNKSTTKKKTPKVQINFGDIPSNNIEPGEYGAVIDHVSVREAKDGKSHYLSWQFTLSDEDVAGRKIWMTTSLKPESFWNLKEQLVALGYPEDSVVDLDWDESLAPTDRDFAMLTEPNFEGVSVVINITEEEYQGRMTPRVSGIISSELLVDDEEDEEDDLDDLDEDEEDGWIEAIVDEEDDEDEELEPEPKQKKRGLI